MSTLHLARQVRLGLSGATFILACLFGLTTIAFNGAAKAAVVIEDATLLGSKSQPVTRSFTIAQAGTYEFTLSDVGFPAAMANLQAAITRGDKLVTALKTPGKITFTATAGTYVLQVAGVAATSARSGTFAVRVAASPAGAVVLDYSDVVTTVQTPAGTDQLTLQTTATLVATGAHRITLTDAAFPAVLSNVALLLTRGGVEYARLDAATPTADFVGSAGVYDLLIVAKASAPAAAGLFGVRIDNLASGTNVVSSSYAVGNLGEAERVTLPAASSYVLTVADLRFPVSLASGSAILIRGSDVLARAATGSAASFNAAGGEAELYALPVVAPPAAVGSMFVELLQGSNRIKSGVQVVSPDTSSSGMTLSSDDVTITSAGTVRSTLTDFDFPASFAELQLGIFQNGLELGRRSGVGNLDVQAAVGTLTVLVAAAPAAPPGSGLFGIQLSTSPTGTLVYERTRATGALFQQRRISVPATGSYDVAISDLEFPARFADFSAAITRGTQKVGFVFGAGKVSFNATPGDYFLNFIARVDPAAAFGTYGLKVEDTPLAPTLTLTAAAATVAAGGSTTLNWTSTNAVSCVASGQWTGSRSTSGNQSVGPINTQSTYTLVCTGAGGSTSKSVVVDVKSASNGGGGGSLDLRLLFILLLLGAAKENRRPVRPGC